MFNFFDKNWLWGGLNIQKRELCVNKILAQDLGFIWGPLQRGFACRLCRSTASLVARQAEIPNHIEVYESSIFL
jgi:hypothetical protein